MPHGKFGAEKYKTLANHQQRLWDLHQRAGESAETPRCVAISRLPGAGGEEIGRQVAEKLGYGFYEREIVEQIASDLHVDSWLVNGLDERVRSAIERFLDDVILRSKRVSESEYLRGVTRTLVTLGRRGSAVIVGRGATCVLSADDALRVLIVAPRAQRIKRYAEIKALDTDRAKAALDFTEQQRTEFMQQQFAARLDDPALYDLAINTGRISFEDAADLVVEALKRRFPSR